jgi:hypothetical protein
MSHVNTGRRAFTATLGGLLAFPGLIDLAGQEARQTGKVSSQALAAALQLTGDTMSDTLIERTGRALEMLSGDLEVLRRFAVPRGVEPAMYFRAR